MTHPTPDSGTAPGLPRDPLFAACKLRDMLRGDAVDTEKAHDAACDLVALLLKNGHASSTAENCLLDIFELAAMIEGAAMLALQADGGDRRAIAALMPILTDTSRRARALIGRVDVVPNGN